VDVKKKKKDLGELLLKSSIISDKFTGRVMIVMSHGGVRGVEITESL